MAGYSYICEIRNVREIVASMERLGADTNAIFHYNPEVLEELNGRTWTHIRCFYYCDQHYGNTIRLYDRQFLRRFQHLYREPRTCVILRGKNLGNASGDLKIAIRRLLGPLEEPPSGINTNAENRENCLRFFARRNVVTGGANDGQA
jgi:hypothetical protein